MTDAQRQWHETFLAAKYAGNALPEPGPQPPAELSAYYDLVRAGQQSR
jgi:hypothetical protein